MGDIYDIVNQKRSQGDVYDIVNRQRESTHTTSYTAMTPDQKLEAQYGRLGEAGLPDVGLRADLSLSRDIGDKVRKFTDAYPYGELLNDPDSGTLLFRKAPSEPWSKLDAPMLDKLEAGDAADIVGDLPAIVGEIIATKGASTLPSTLLRGFFGAATGDLSRSVSEKTRGYMAPGMFQSAGTEGMLSVGGELAGAGVRGVVNAGRGAGAIQPAPFVGKTMREAERQGVTQLHPGQASENPIIQAFARQSRALSGKIHDYELGQEGDALNLVESLRARGEAVGLPKELETALARRENDLRRRLVSAPADQTSGGKALRKGIEEYRDMSGRAVDVAYAKARDIAEPGFDIKNVLEVAGKIEAGVQALAKSGELERASEVPPELLKAIGRLRSLDPAALLDPRASMEAGADAPFDILKSIRSTLFDLKNPTDGVYRNEHRLANDLYVALTNAMKNPTGGGADFLEEWAKATGLASNRFTTLEQDYIARTLRSHEGGDVEGLYRSIFRPNNANQAGFVRQIVPDARWAEFKQSAIADLVSDPKKMWSRLSEFDDATLKEVFTGPEIDQLKGVAYQFVRLEQTGIRKAMDRQTTSNAIVRDMIEGMNTGGADALFDLAGGRNTDMGRRVRAGIMEWIADTAVERTKTGRRVDREGIMASIETLRQNGLLKFLTPSDKRALHSFLPDYLSLIRAVRTDAGESMRRGAIIQKLTDKTSEAVLDIMEEVGVGRLMTTARGQKWIYGFRGKPWDMTAMKRLSAGLAILADDYETETE